MLGFCAVLFCVESVYAQGWTDTCAHLKEWRAVNPSDEVVSKEQFDTLRIFIERCAASDDLSWQVFTSITAAAQFMSNDLTRFDKYRAWLVSVLYLNKTVSQYFCECMGAIISTFQNGKYKAIGTLAVENYIRAHHRNCYGANEDKQYTKDSLSLVQGGFDAVNLPPLDSLGLGDIIRHDANAAVQNLTSPSQTSLALFTSSPNPFIKETTLKFTLSRMAYITLAVYDELGKLVWGDGRGSSLEAGTHQIRLDGASFPNGVFYARISTGFGGSEDCEIGA